MARRDRYTIGHIYQPTSPRQAYGRRWSSRQLLEELPRHMIVLAANEEPTAPLETNTPSTPSGAPDGARRVAIPMPHGGVRWLLECPKCRRHVSQLYDSEDLRNDPVFRHSHSGWCRTCSGFRYRSQYEGRRPEAARERVDALRQSAHASRDLETRQRRLERAEAVEWLRTVRDMRHKSRKSQAFNLACLPALLRFSARINRLWLQAVGACLRQPAEQRAAMAHNYARMAEQCTAEDDTFSAGYADWAASVLLASLGSDSEASLRQSSAAPPPPAEPSAELGGEHGGITMTPELLADLRAEYAAHTQRRRRRRAA